jgi:hypothetical protein
MLKRTLLLPLFLIPSLSILSVLKPAQAVPATMTFNGSVAASCVFGEQTDGTLLESDLDANGITDQLDIDTYATLDVTCNDAFSVTISSPRITASPTGFVAANYTCYSEVQDSTFSTSTGASAPCNSQVPSAPMILGAEGTVNVDTLQASAGLQNADLPAGSYTLQVQVDATAN